MSENVKNINEKQEFTKEMFEKVDRSKLNSERISRPTIKYWSDVFRRLKMNKLAMFGIIVIVLLAIAASAEILGDVLFKTKITGYSYFEQDYSSMNVAPNGKFIFGTDSLGRDIFTRILYGTGYSLLIGVATAFISFTIGILYRKQVQQNLGVSKKYIKLVFCGIILLSKSVYKVGRNFCGRRLETTPHKQFGDADFVIWI